MQKKIVTILIVGTIVSFLLTIIQGTSKVFLHFTNSIFYIGLVLLIVGGFLFVIESGFFNLTRFGMKKVFKRNEDKVLSMTGEESTEVSKEMIYKKYSFSITKPFLFSAFSFIALSLIFSFIILS
ncbi:DUF3899 domain-containing protein [Bacillus sp. RG28]|uniref:DUF3899 domain-containing protein n=1 Tax=Gottfriedia endophytica TaxID=2820819 RepID=A0A940NTI6_9BACI|nr:DUF3899 domain-containing protein [Gottfriedia endophytica]MBP0724588.1 DUF3899 domain-containing protein [Gottfriedia endophytica]